VVTRPEDELSLLQRSRASLRGDAAAALQLAEQHARDYPAGLFVQERELLAIQALLKQRRDAEAATRAERFVAAYATSAYAARVREMLQTNARIVAALHSPEPDGSTP
jgi:outer membrane protein assembly factor BamD (BamD/ComL family)